MSRYGGGCSSCATADASRQPALLRPANQRAQHRGAGVPDKVRCGRGTNRLVSGLATLSRASRSSCTLVARLSRIQEGPRYLVSVAVFLTEARTLAVLFCPCKPLPPDRAGSC